VTLLAAAGLTKFYGPVCVLDDVSLEVGRGEIHALAGENGAGKSTLIKIIAGATAPDRGTVSLDGAPLPIGDPLATRRRGVSIVYQEFTLVPDLSIADNVFLGRERGSAWLRRGDMHRAVQTLLNELGVRVSAGTRVRGLSVAHQQMVEIARALATDAKVLILDEPTASLSGAEVTRLMEVLRTLRGRGLGIIYVSHRLEELFAIADRITVLRDGRHVTTVPCEGVTRTQLIRWIVGRDVSEEFPPRAPSPGDTVVEVEHMASPPRFRDVSFDVRAGEIVGLAGLVGAGRTSSALAIVGAIPSSGDLRVGHRRARFTSPGAALRAGVAYVTEDRKGRGILPLMTAGENITISSLRAFVSGGLLRPSRERAAANAAAREFDVRAASLRQRAATLSGGNQQKMLLARYLLQPRTLLILDEPTRGVDVGARAEIYSMMNRLTGKGLGILMISSDLPEVLGMADRIVVMREGRTAGALARAEATPERVMALATGQP
jgi:ABC-type sugar transport system ATPase subunit